MRHTGSLIYQVATGRGWSEIGGKRFEWEEKDIFCVPSWTRYRHGAHGEAVLFSFNDLPGDEGAVAVPRSSMISREQNELMTRIGPGTPAGQAAAPLLAAGGAGGRDAGRAAGEGGSPVLRESGSVQDAKRLRADAAPLPAPRRRPGLRPHRARRPALLVPRLEVRRRGQVRRDARRARRQPAVRAHQDGFLSGGREERHPVRLPRRRRGAGVSRTSTASSRRTPTPSPSRATGTATGCRRWRSASTRRTPRGCTSTSRTRTRRAATASSSAACRRTRTCRSARCCASTTGPRSASSAPSTACACRRCAASATRRPTSASPTSCSRRPSSSR